MADRYRRGVSHHRAGSGGAREQKNVSRIGNERGSAENAAGWRAATCHNDAVLAGASVVNIK